MTAADRFAAPDWLPDDVRRHHRVLVESIGRQHLDPHPSTVLLLAQALTQYDRVTTFLNTHGQVLEIRNDKGELKANIIAPEAQLQLKLIDKIRSLLKDVGLDGTEATDAEEESRAGLRRTETRRAGPCASSDASQGGGRAAASPQIPPGVARLRARLAHLAGSDRPR